MFCAIATTIDRCKTEGVVDVFQVVKALRIHKPGAVLNVVSKSRLIQSSSAILWHMPITVSCVASLVVTSMAYVMLLVLRWH